MDLHKIDSAGQKIFKLGVVKAAGDISVPFTGRLPKKKEALNRIPVEEICSILFNEYGLEVDISVDRTIKIAKERVDVAGHQGTTQLYTYCKNPYYGNLEYLDVHPILLVFGADTNIIADPSVTDFLNITYTFEIVPFIFKVRFLYNIVIKSSSDELLSIQGAVASIPLPRKGLFGDTDAVWDAYVKHAAHIDEVLRDELANKQNE